MRMFSEVLLTLLPGSESIDVYSERTKKLFIILLNSCARLSVSISVFSLPNPKWGPVNSDNDGKDTSEHEEDIQTSSSTMLDVEWCDRLVMNNLQLEICSWVLRVSTMFALTQNSAMLGRRKRLTASGGEKCLFNAREKMCRVVVKLVFGFLCALSQNEFHDTTMKSWPKSLSFMSREKSVNAKEEKTFISDFSGKLNWSPVLTTCRWLTVTERQKNHSNSRCKKSRRGGWGLVPVRLNNICHSPSCLTPLVKRKNSNLEWIKKRQREE